MAVVIQQKIKVYQSMGLLNIQNIAKHMKRITTKNHIDYIKITNAVSVVLYQYTNVS